MKTIRYVIDPKEYRTGGLHAFLCDIASTITDASHKLFVDGDHTLCDPALEQIALTAGLDTVFLKNPDPKDAVRAASCKEGVLLEKGVKELRLPAVPDIKRLQVECWAPSGPKDPFRVSLLCGTSSYDHAFTTRMFELVRKSEPAAKISVPGDPGARMRLDESATPIPVRPGIRRHVLNGMSAAVMKNYGKTSDRLMWEHFSLRVPTLLVCEDSSDDFIITGLKRLLYDNTEKKRNIQENFKKAISNDLRYNVQTIKSFLED